MLLYLFIEGIPYLLPIAHVAIHHTRTLSRQPGDSSPLHAAPRTACSCARSAHRGRSAGSRQRRLQWGKTKKTNGTRTSENKNQTEMQVGVWEESGQPPPYEQQAPWATRGRCKQADGTANSSSPPVLSTA
jgi:hypothetical protein